MPELTDPAGHQCQKKCVASAPQNAPMIQIDNGHLLPTVKMTCESVFARSGCLNARASKIAKNAIPPSAPSIQGRSLEISAMLRNFWNNRRDADGPGHNGVDEA